MEEPKIIDIGEKLSAERPAGRIHTSEGLSAFMKNITVPLSRRGWPRWLVFLGAGLGMLYILNPTAGILEFIPDNLPFIGNLDEGLAFVLIYYGLVEFFEGGKHLPSIN